MIRLDDLTPAQRRLFLAMVALGKSTEKAAPAVSEAGAASSEVRHGSATPTR
jgi:hypothetical protein